jgi:2-oxoisovalerate dehydrogenase E1 component alpha subunit
MPNLVLILITDGQRSSYENMVMLPIVDNILYNVQRQGKISFYVGRTTYVSRSQA